MRAACPAACAAAPHARRTIRSIPWPDPVGECAWLAGQVPSAGDCLAVLGKRCALPDDGVGCVVLNDGELHVGGAIRSATGSASGLDISSRGGAVLLSSPNESKIVQLNGSNINFASDGFSSSHSENFSFNKLSITGLTSEDTNLSLV